VAKRKNNNTPPLPGIDIPLSTGEKSRRSSILDALSAQESDIGRFSLHPDAAERIKRLEDLAPEKIKGGELSLALDLGVTSVGFALYRHESIKKEEGTPPPALADYGVYMFDSHYTGKSGESKQKIRRLKAAQRRIIRLKRYRRWVIYNALSGVFGDLDFSYADNVCPGDAFLKLRGEDAFTTRLSPKELFCLFRNLSKVRGYAPMTRDDRIMMIAREYGFDEFLPKKKQSKTGKKSNKGGGKQGTKDKDDSLSTLSGLTRYESFVEKYGDELRERFGTVTPGMISYRLSREGERSSLRNYGGKEKITVAREETEKEINAIFDAQERLGGWPTDERGKEARKAITEAIIRQDLPEFPETRKGFTGYSLSADIFQFLKKTNDISLKKIVEIEDEKHGGKKRKKISIWEALGDAEGEECLRSARESLFGYLSDLLQGEKRIEKEKDQEGKIFYSDVREVCAKSGSCLSDPDVLIYGEEDTRVVVTKKKGSKEEEATEIHNVFASFRLLHLLPSMPTLLAHIGAPAAFTEEGFVIDYDVLEKWDELSETASSGVPSIKRFEKLIDSVVGDESVDEETRRALARDLLFFMQKKNGKPVSYTREVLYALLGKMAEGIPEHEAKEMIADEVDGIETEENYSGFEKSLDLIAPEKLLKRYESDYDDQITNHGVKKIINRAIEVVRAASEIYGPLSEVVIESGRELRDKLSKQQSNRSKDRQDALRKEAESRLKELGISTAEKNVKKMKMLIAQRWFDPYLLHDRKKRIIRVGSQADLDALEIDHLVPRAFGGSSMFENMVVTRQYHNQKKGKRLPSDYMSSVLSPDEYQEWRRLVADYTYTPQKKSGTKGKGKDGTRSFDRELLSPKTRDILLAESMEDVERVISIGNKNMLQATMYAEKLLGRVLKMYYPFAGKTEEETFRRRAKGTGVRYVSGRIVQNVRYRFVPGLKKSRESNLHHIEDAVIAGLTDRSLLNRVTRDLRKAYEKMIAEGKSEIDKEAIVPKEKVAPRVLDRNGEEVSLKELIWRIRDGYFFFWMPNGPRPKEEEEFTPLYRELDITETMDFYIGAGGKIRAVSWYFRPGATDGTAIHEDTVIGIKVFDGEKFQIKRVPAGEGGDKNTFFGDYFFKKLKKLTPLLNKGLDTPLSREEILAEVEKAVSEEWEKTLAHFEMGRGVKGLDYERTYGACNLIKKKMVDFIDGIPDLYERLAEEEAEEEVKGRKVRQKRGADEAKKVVESLMRETIKKALKKKGLYSRKISLLLEKTSVSTKGVKVGAGYAEKTTDFIGLGVSPSLKECRCVEIVRLSSPDFERFRKKYREENIIWRGHYFSASPIKEPKKKLHGLLKSARRKKREEEPCTSFLVTRFCPLFPSAPPMQPKGKDIGIVRGDNSSLSEKTISLGKKEDIVRIEKLMFGSAFARVLGLIDLDECGIEGIKRADEMICSGKERSDGGVEKSIP